MAICLFQWDSTVKNKIKTKKVNLMKTQEKITKMFKSLDELFNEFVELIGEDAFDNHWTGSLVVKYIDDCNTIRIKKMYAVDAMKAEKYFVLAPEKANRLRSFMLSGHLTSYESRNPNATILVNGTLEQWGRWGGAVVISRQLIFSFSGLPELLDEAFVCFLGLKSNLMSQHQFALIKKIRTNNPYLDLVHKALIKK